MTLQRLRTYPHDRGYSRYAPGSPAKAPERSPQRALPPLRRFQVSYLGRDGTVSELQRAAPALPAFEEAFSAFARGTLVTTADGPVAVEDLLPGTLVQTSENGPQPLLWSGSITLIPARASVVRQDRLTRISADSFGLGRPMPDLLLGPAARLFQSRARLPATIGARAALVPAAGFADGDAVIRVSPVSPVQVFHLAFASHQVIRVNGLECESYHPGHAAELALSGEMLTLFLALFPHLNALEGFGQPAHPRLSLEDLQLIGAE